MNIDASCSPLIDSCGIGLAIQNRSNMIIHAKDKFIRHCSSSFHAETLTVLEGINSTISGGYKISLIQSDAKVVVQSLKDVGSYYLRSSSCRTFCFCHML